MTQPYLLTRHTEVERLRLQSGTLQPVAEALLDVIGIRPGWRCLDVAGGPMSVLGPLARRAGPTGVVVGRKDGRRCISSSSSTRRMDALRI